jgi:hypothetical protein
VDDCPQSPEASKLLGQNIPISRKLGALKLPSLYRNWRVAILKFSAEVGSFFFSTTLAGRIKMEGRMWSGCKDLTA